jgi:predicted alpha/beta hydrolase family esterase
VAARFLILHGLHGSQGPHWQRWLQHELEALGAEVRFPALPRPDAPVLDEWLAALARELDRTRELTVLCHSLGCILWLHHAAVRPAPVRRVLLNAPPEPLPAVPSFFPVATDGGAVRAAAAVSRLVCSDDDPYCPAGAATVYGEPLGLATDLLPGQGHLNVDAGYGPWPAMLSWCRGERDDIASAGTGGGANQGAET